MARFGRDFVRAATQPAFTQGLFTAAQQIGSAPARRRELQRQEQQKLNINEAIALGNRGIVENDPVALVNAAQILRQQGQTDESIRFAQAAGKAKEFQDKRIAEESRSSGVVSRLEQLGQPEAASLVKDKILTASKGADIIFGLVSQERKNKIPPEMLRRLGELSQTDENAKMVLEDITENDSREALSRAYNFLEDYGKEDEPQTPKDYSLTKAEEKVYNELLRNNEKEFEGLLPTKPAWFGRTKTIDYQKRVIFDEAERIRVNSPETISKKEALKRAFRAYGRPEQTSTVEQASPVGQGEWSITKRG